MSTHPILNIATKAALAAGSVIARNMDRIDGLEIHRKGVNDFVTKVDLQAEQAIIDTIRAAYPEHAVLAEESGTEKGAATHSDSTWIIDPLDGTTNFLHGFPQYAVSIAFRHKDRIEQAVVYNPVNQEMFTATRGAGAFINNRRIRVSKRRSLDGALLGTGFPFRDNGQLDRFLDTFKALFGEVAGIRRAGSAALDLAYVAAGRLDGFWEFDLQPWDIAAGVLLVQEAGGLVTDCHGGHGFMDSGDIAVGNARIMKEMLKRFQPILQRYDGETQT